MFCSTFSLTYIWLTRNRLRSLTTVLSVVGSIVERNLKDDRQQQANEICDTCNTLLGELTEWQVQNSEILDTTKTGAQSAKRIWKRLRYKPEKVVKFRNRVTSSVALLSAFRQAITSDDVSKVVQAEDARERLQILDWISNLNYGSQLSDNFDRAETGTRQWFLDSPEYLTWFSTRGRVLFCPGIPGAGKTILASVVIRHLQEHYKTASTVSICYLFCNFRKALSLQSMMRVVLRQLCQTQPVIHSAVESAFLLHKMHKIEPKTSDWTQLLQDVAVDLSRVFLVADALDECPNDRGVRSAFVEELLKLKEASNINVLFTTRPFPDLCLRLGGFPRIDVLAHEADVRMFLESPAAQRLPKCVTKDPDFQRQVINEIIKAIDGM